MAADPRPKLDPQTDKQAAGALLQLFAQMQTQLTNVGGSLDRLYERLNQLGSMTGRVTASLLLLAGPACRPFLSVGRPHARPAVIFPVGHQRSLSTLAVCLRGR
jgi:hypothetical protein